MAEELISNLGYGAPQSDTNRQKHLECIFTGNSKLYLGKAYTDMYSMGACSALGITNQKAMEHPRA